MLGWVAIAAAPAMVPASVPIVPAAATADPIPAAASTGVSSAFVACIVLSVKVVSEFIGASLNYRVGATKPVDETSASTVSRLTSLNQAVPLPWSVSPKTMFRLDLGTLTTI